ncbi:branched-chain amino acid ABC transporter permease, partial [candidate division KSB1 bacterium]|nr:branched-chain amino acid ABC transporter permease [candidate division KSB1 bacterium]
SYRAAMQALGKNVTRYKILVFVMGGALVAIAGALYAHYVTFIDPTSFTILESIFMISIVIVGGAGSLKGSVVGAAVLIVLPEMLRFLGMPNAIAANMRQIIYGALLVVMMIFRPKGLVGEYELK